MKEEGRLDGPYEFGAKPLRRCVKTDWDEAFDNAKSGELAKIPASVMMQHYGNIKKIQKDFMPKVPPCDHLRGIWITGKSGVGKSVYARKHYPDYYAKDCNKWWDGY